MLKIFKKKDVEPVQETPADGPVQPGEDSPQAKASPPEETNKKGFFERLKDGLSKTRSTLTARLDRLILGKREITEDLLDELEEILFTSDIGVATTQELIDSVRQKVARKELSDADRLKANLKDHMLSFLKVQAVQRPGPAQGQPLVIMVVGINGVGKTTTLGKAAHKFQAEGKRVMVVAADTFRAAAIEQLSIWAQRAGAEIIKQSSGSDPSAVVFDALTAAMARGFDVVLIDTAGRLHTKTNLMDELQKINRVTAKKLPGAPHEVWLILDATTGQNAISQAQVFDKTLGISHIILTKLDGTAKGGIVIGICHQLGIPIKYIGIGEKVDDLRPFDPEDFVQALFD